RGPGRARRAGPRLQPPERLEALCHRRGRAALQFRFRDPRVRGAFHVRPARSAAAARQPASGHDRRGRRAASRRHGARDRRRADCDVAGAALARAAGGAAARGGQARDAERARPHRRGDARPARFSDGGCRVRRARARGLAPLSAAAGAGPQQPEGYAEKLLVRVQHGPIESLSRAAAKTVDISVFSLKMLGKMLIGEVSWRHLSGPVTIADFAGQSASLGWVSYLTFLALISISLGVLNLLPIPLLDGGHLMYYAIEIVKGKPVSERFMELGQRVGLALLLVMM